MSMQVQAEPSQLISRAGGKNVTTQLSKGDPEIVQEVSVPGVKKLVPLMMYAEAQTRALFYQALHEIQKDSKPSPQLVVLRDTAKVFLDPKYKPQLLSAETGQIGSLQTAQNVDLKAYRANLTNLREDYVKKGMKAKVDCVDTLLTALDKNQLLTLAQLQQVYDVLGDDVNVPKMQLRQLLDQMVKNGTITPAEAKEIENKIQGDAKVGDVAKQSPEMIVGPDGKVISKKKSEGPSVAPSAGGGGGGYKKWPTPPPRYTPHTNRLLKGQACGPSKTPQQMYMMTTHDYGMAVDLPDDDTAPSKTTTKGTASKAKPRGK